MTCPEKLKKMKKSVTNLQPWLDYFKILQSYEEKGLLEVSPDKGEAYVTLPALLSLTDTEESPDAVRCFVKDAARMTRQFAGVLRILRILRIYAGWKSQQGESFLKKPFAMNVVEDALPHNPLFTMLLTSRRTWRSLWVMADDIDVITYSGEGRGV